MSLTIDLDYKLLSKPLNKHNLVMSLSHHKPRVTLSQSLRDKGLQVQILPKGMTVPQQVLILPRVDHVWIFGLQPNILYPGTLCAELISRMIFVLFNDKGPTRCLVKESWNYHYKSYSPGILLGV